MTCADHTSPGFGEAGLEIAHGMCARTPNSSTKAVTASERSQVASISPGTAFADGVRKQLVVNRS